MDKFSNIVDRIKMMLNLEQDKDLANYLNISPILLSAWKQRNSPTERFLLLIFKRFTALVTILQQKLLINIFLLIL